MLSILPSLFILSLAALFSLHLAASRPSPPDYQLERYAAARILALATAVQSIHFLEEAATGFHERFPAMFGLPAMPFSYFIVFNLAWLVIWAISVPGLRQARFGAFFAAWFLAIAGTINLIAHPLLSIAAGGYFPGLASSPFIGSAGLWLWHRLQRATSPSSG